jgi:hypothetical protein
VARKQIELATCGLRQIKAKIWKFFFVTLTDGISGHLCVSQSVVSEMVTVQDVWDGFLRQNQSPRLN